MTTKQIDIEIDQQSWNQAPHNLQHPLPHPFQRTPQSDHVNVWLMLQNIGLLTTPMESLGLSLAEYWAWVRYGAAVSDEGPPPDETEGVLRVTTEDVDPKRKSSASIAH